MATDEEIMAEWDAAQIGQSDAEIMAEWDAANPEFDTGGAVQTLAQGGAWGFGDEGAAALIASGNWLGDTWRAIKGEPVPSWSELYEGELGGIRGRMGAFAEANPKTAIGLEMLGGMGSLGGGVRKAATEGSEAAARSIWSTLGKASAAGAGGAGVYGFGSGRDGLWSRAESAADAAKYGAGFGLGIGGAGVGISAMLRSRMAEAVKRRMIEMGPAGSTTKGERLLLKTLDSATDEEIIRAKQRMDLAAERGQPLSLVDALATGEGFAEGKFARGSKGGRDVAERIVEQKQGGAPARITSLLDDISPEQDVYAGAQRLRGGAEEIVDELKAVRDAEARPYFRELADTAGAIESPKVAAILQKPTVKAIIKNLREDFPELVEGLPDNHYLVLKEVKEGLSDIYSRSAAAGERKTAGRWGRVLEDLTSELDDNLPLYGEARDVYAARSREIAALEGQKWGGQKQRGTLEGILSANPENVTAQVGALMKQTPAQVAKINDAFVRAGKAEHLRAGMRAYFQRQIDTAATGVLGTKGGSIVDKVFRDADTFQKMRIVLGDEDAAKLFNRAEAEGLMRQGIERTFPSSPTQSLQATSGFWKRAAKAFTPIRTFKELAKQIAESEDEALSREMAELLFDPKTGRKALSKLIGHQASIQEYRGVVDALSAAGIQATAAAGGIGASSASGSMGPLGGSELWRAEQSKKKTSSFKVDTVKTSASGIDFIKKTESFSATAYPDHKGYSIGYGHLGAKKGDTITREEAEVLLQQDVAEAEDAVERLVEVPLSENQHAALVSFVYNVGEGDFTASTLLRMLNDGDFEGAQKQFARWIYAGPKGKKKKQEGLIKRRKAEAELFGRA